MASRASPESIGGNFHEKNNNTLAYFEWTRLHMLWTVTTHSKKKKHVRVGIPNAMLFPECTNDTVKTKTFKKKRCTNKCGGLTGLTVLIISLHVIDKNSLSLSHTHTMRNKNIIKYNTTKIS